MAGKSGGAGANAGEVKNAGALAKGGGNRSSLKETATRAGVDGLGLAANGLLDRRTSKTGSLNIKADDDALAGSTTAKGVNSPRLTALNVDRAVRGSGGKGSKTNTPVLGSFAEQHDALPPGAAAGVSGNGGGAAMTAAAAAAAKAKRPARPRPKYEGLHDSLSPKGLPPKRLHKKSGSIVTLSGMSQSGSQSQRGGNTGRKDGGSVGDGQGNGTAGSSQQMLSANNSASNSGSASGTPVDVQERDEGGFVVDDGAAGSGAGGRSGRDRGVTRGRRARRDEEDEMGDAETMDVDDEPFTQDVADGAEVEAEGEGEGEADERRAASRQASSRSRARHPPRTTRRGSPPRDGDTTLDLDADADVDAYPTDEPNTKRALAASQGQASHSLASRLDRDAEMAGIVAGADFGEDEDMEAGDVDVDVDVDLEDDVLVEEHGDGDIEGEGEGDGEGEGEGEDDAEARYCYCQAGSYGEMVACDNEECPREWFHLECIGLKSVPKSKEWFCDECRQMGFGGGAVGGGNAAEGQALGSAGAGASGSAGGGGNARVTGRANGASRERAERERKR
jgi:hypothetical protein